MAKETTAVILARLDERIKHMSADVSEIKTDTAEIKGETKKTNGRVTALETKMERTEKLESRVQVLENDKSFLKGSWKTIAIGAGSAGVLVGIIELVRIFI